MGRASRGRAAALILLLNAAAEPARALTRSASLNWNFSDITTKDPSGRARYSSWGQSYGLNLGGALLHRAVGLFNAGGSYSEGANINSTVNTGVTGQRSLGANVALDFFHPDVQRYIRFAPNYSVQSLKTKGGQERAVTNDHWGYSTGLSLPYLPAFSASRQYNRVRDSYGPVPTDQRQTLMNENLSYHLGRLRLNASQERHRTENNRLDMASPLATTQRGSLDYGHGNIKPLKLQYLSLHSEYLRFANAGQTTGKSLSTLVNLRTFDLGWGLWKHSLNYTNDSRRDLLRKTQEMSQTMLLSSNRPVPRGRFVNSMSGNVSGRGTANRSASIAPYLSLIFQDGRVLTAFSGNVGWTRTPGSTFLTDSAGTRLDLKPRRTLEFFADLQTSESLPLTEDIAGGRRNSRIGLGSSRRYGGGETSLRYDHTRERLYSTGLGSNSDQVNLSASATPAQRFNLSAGGSFSRTRTTEGGGYSSKNVTGSMNYSTLWGLTVSSDISFTDSRQYTTNSAIGYSLGKTSLNVTHTYTATPLPSSYSYLSLSLSRAL
ncbi:MAG: hypothetical protein AAB036_06940 [Elusimicrobiota bacterium]